MSEVYIERDPKTGAIKGVYANPQPQPDGSCLTDTKPVAADDPEVVAFKSSLGGREQ